MNERSKILVVDDNVIMLEFLSESICTDSCIVEKTQSAKECLELIKAISFDLIILDIQMPIMDGFTVCKIIKKSERNSNTPVIFLTGETSTPTKVKAFEVGAVDFIVKPFEKEELIARVKVHVRNRKNEKKLSNYKQILEASSTVLVRWGSKEGNSLQTVTENVEKLLGYTADELLSKKIFFYNLIHQDDIERVQKAVLLNSANRKIISFQHKPYRVITKKNQVKWISDKITIVRDKKGGILYYDGVVEDVTKQQELILDLKKSKQSLRTILDANTDAVILTNTNYELKYRNSAVMKMSNTEANNAKCYETLFGLDSPCSWCRMTNNFLEKPIEEIIHPETNKRYLISSGNIDNYESDENVFMTVYKDVSIIRATEFERMSYFNILKSSKNGVIIINSASLKIKYANLGALNAFGYNKEEVNGISILNLIKEEFTGELKDRFKLLEEAKSTKETIETINVKKDGSVYPAEINIQYLKQNNNSVFLINSADLTEKRKQLKQIRTLKTGIEQSPISIVITDKEGAIQFVNQQFTKTTGYSAQEALGKKPNVLKSGNHEDAFYQNMWKTISSGSVWQGELQNKTKSGELFWEDASINPITDKMGRITNYIALKVDISARKKMTYEIDVINRINKAMVNVAKIGYVVVDKQHQVSISNPKFEELINSKIKVNSKIPDYFEKKDEIKNCLSSCFKTGEKQKLLILKKDNEQEDQYITASFSLVSHAKKQSVLFIIKDITHFLNLEKKLKTETILRHNLTSIVKQPVFSLDKQFQITSWNKAMEGLLGFHKSELLGRNIKTLKNFEKDNPQLMYYIKKSSKRKSLPNYRLGIKSKQGKLSVVIFNSYLISDEIIFIGQDITDIENSKIELENQVKERTVELEVALEKEKELNEMKSRFVSVASHEFRTPLSVINFASTYTQRYWDRISEEERNLKFTKIEDQVNHMTSLLDDVLIFGKYESRKISAKPENVNCKSFFDKIFDEIHSSTHGTHKIKIEGCLDCVIFIDKSLARNVFINLLSNAIKFSPNENKIVFKVDNTTENTVFSIQDYGIGVQQSELKTIFQPFVRGDNVNTIQGTGLGLAIVKESIEIMNGEISVSSKVGKGTTFTITLPKFQ